MKGANVEKNVRVFTRILPSQEKQWEYIKVLDDRKTIYARCLQDFQKGTQNTSPNFWTFKTDGIFFSECQARIYRTVTFGVLDSVFKGNNAAILAYGQTGTGKSLTVGGLENSFEDRGIAPRIISDLFRKKDETRDEFQTSILMSYVEMDNRYINDLLQKTYNLLDVFAMKKILLVKVNDEYQALKHLFTAEGRREVVENKTYLSNKCTAVLTFHIFRKFAKLSKPMVLHSKLHIIDLAGCDTFGNSTCLTKNTSDIGTANLAKTQLEQFILTLIDDVPARISVKKRLNLLISYLGDSLNSTNTIRFVCHIRTDRDNLLVTLSQLRFIRIIKNLKPKKMKEEEVEGVVDEEYQAVEQLKKMEFDERINQMIANSTLATNINQDRYEHMFNVISEYLSNKTNEIVVMNVTDASTILDIFKKLYQQQESDKQDAVRQAYNKAYQDAIASMKEVIKTDSKISVKGVKGTTTKRSSLKSKDSVVSSETKTCRRRRRSSSEKREHRLSLRSSRRSKGSSLIQIKKEKKQSSSISLSDIGLDEKTLNDLFLPENVPDPQVAWEAFISTEGYNFSDLKDQLAKAELDAKQLHYMYLYESKEVPKFLNLVDVRREELYRAGVQERIYEKVNGDQEEENAEATNNRSLTDLEKMCLELLALAEGELIHQQEMVLKLQADFKVALDWVKQIKQEIRSRFASFCQAAYGTLSEDASFLLKKESCDKSLEYDDVLAMMKDDAEDGEAKEDKDEQIRGIYTFLQNLMRNERIRYKAEKQKKRRWMITFNVHKCRPK